MKIQRDIGVYQKIGDALIEAIIFDLPKSLLIELFHVDAKEDPHVYDVYLINELQFFKLKELIPELIKYDFNEVEMYVECFQIN